MHPNAQSVLRGFRAFAEGDMETLKGVLADDVTWHVAGRNKWSGDYSGPDAVVEYLSGVSAEATIETQPHAVLADDDHVVVLGNASSSRNGKSFSSNIAYVFHISTGRITAAWVVPADQYGQDEFWAD